MAAPQEFISTLFGSSFPDKLHASTWTKSDKTSHYFDDPAAADRFAGQTDVYVAVCLTTPGPANGRIKAANARALAGFWIDVDLAGPEDPASKKPARNRDEGLALINHVHEPTLVVNSGYGLQAWWLLEEPWVFGSEAEHQQAARIAQGWETLHRNQARAEGFNIDSVHDLARIMRLPGTINGKGDGAPVELLDHDGPRYSLETIAPLAMNVPVPEKQRPGGGRQVKLDAAFPMVKFEALKENLPTFAATWEHKRRDREAGGWSMSEHDLALASFAARAGWSDDEITALIVFHRQKYEGMGSEKAGRPDYVAATLAKSRNGIQREERTEVREAALERLAEIGDSPSGTVDSDTVLGHFNTVVGGGISGAPAFKELVQYGTDREAARFVLVTESGLEVDVGPYANLRQPRRLDEAIGPATGFVMETVKDNETWRAAVRALLKARQLREEPEEPVLEWVRRFTLDRLGADRDHAVQAREPFLDDGYVYVRLDELARYVRGVMKQRIGSDSDLKPKLRRAGFEEHKVHFARQDGKRSTAAYWRIQHTEIEQ